MPPFRNLLLLLTLSLGATTTAATCPQSWLKDTALNGDSKCCYGNMIIEGRDAYCCVNDMAPQVETSGVSTATTTSVVGHDSWSTAGGCLAKIPFTASDYSDQVSSASSKIAAAATTIATNEATSTTASSSSSTSSNTSSESAASTTNAAVPIAAAQEIMLGGVAAFVGLFVL